MPQLGSGNGSGYPEQIDTRQTFINSPAAAPDSASRVDMEVINDALHAIVQLQHTLGARPQGDSASVAARLQQFFPGGGTTPIGFGFATTTSVTIPGTAHNLGTSSPLIEIYDNASPRNSLEPNTISINTTTYDVTVTFVTPQSGVVCLANPLPHYSTTFTNQTTVAILGSTHGLGTALLFASAYTVIGGEQVQRSPSSVTVHTGTYDVLVTFTTPQSGVITLSAAGPRYSTSFLNQTSITVVGSTHGLATAALLYQVYDNAEPRALIEPNSLSVDQSTYTVGLTFATPQSGTLLLVGASAISGQEFQLRDHGVTNVSAVRVYSFLGALQLQMGSGERVNVQNATGQVVHSTDASGNLVINGTATKPGGGPWLSPSDARLKTVLRPFTDGLDLLRQLEPVWFVHNGLGGIRPDGREHVSLIAQEAQAVASYLVTTQPGQLAPDAPPVELLTLDTGPILYMLMNAVKTLAQQSQDQAARLARLEAVVLAAEDEHL